MFDTGLRYWINLAHLLTSAFEQTPSWRVGRVSFLSGQTDQLVVYDSASGVFHRDDNIQRYEARISKLARARTSNGGEFRESTPSVAPVAPRQVLDRGSCSSRKTFPLHARLVASALRYVRYIHVLCSAIYCIVVYSTLYHG